MQEKIKRLQVLHPLWLEYESLKKDIATEAVEKGERYQDEVMSISLASRKSYVPKYTAEELKEIMPIAVTTETKVVDTIDIELLKSLEDYDKYIDVKETNYATIKFAKEK